MDSIKEIKHNLIREALNYCSLKPGVEISSLADIPAGTGLGSSGTFTVGLLKAILAYQKKLVSNYEIADLACHLEIDVLGEPVGKQDQFIAALGGLTAFEFSTNGKVSASAVRMNRSTREDLEENLLLFYTGIQRSASDELAPVSTNTSSTSDMTANLKEVMKSGYKSVVALETGDLQLLAQLFNEQWDLKFQRSPSPVHAQVNGWIQEGISAGALGGKLIGAGGGGFLMFFAEEKSRLRETMRQLGLREVKFGFDYEGSVLL